MALPASIACLLLSLLVAVMPVPCMAMASSSLIQCSDPITNATSNSTDSSFRASLLPLLDALPSAAAPTGFAALRSKSDSAFARGLCFAEWNGTVPADCLGCLSIAARNLASGCGATTRRAGIWTGRCFVAYADTDACSPAEDAFRSRVLLRGGAVTDADLETYYLHDMLVAVAQDVALSAAANISGPRMLGTATDSTVWHTVHVLAQCAGDRTAAECARCLQESARAVDWNLDADRRDGGVAAAVVGFNCYLRFNVSNSLEPQETAFAFHIVIRVLGALLFVAVVLYAQFAYHRIIANGKKKTTEDMMDAHQRP